MVILRRRIVKSVKNVDVSEIVVPRSRRKPVLRWKDKLKEYMHASVADKEEGIELARRECWNRESWRLFCRGHPLGKLFWRK